MVTDLWLTRPLAIKVSLMISLWEYVTYMILHTRPSCFSYAQHCMKKLGVAWCVSWGYSLAIHCKQGNVIMHDWQFVIPDSKEWTIQMKFTTIIVEENLMTNFSSFLASFLHISYFLGACMVSCVHALNWFTHPQPTWQTDGQNDSNSHFTVYVYAISTLVRLSVEVNLSSSTSQVQCS